MSKTILERVILNERLTRQQVAKASGLTLLTVNTLYLGDRAPLQSTAEKLVSGLNTLAVNRYDVSDIFPGYRNPPKRNPIQPAAKRLASYPPEAST